MLHSFRYQDFVDEQRKGLVHGVFIDDTGSPGLQYTPTNLHPKRKTRAAVIVPRVTIAEVWEQLPRALEELKNLTKASEFHFSDIYAGRKDFKSLSLQKLLAIFEFMAYIFAHYNFPIFVQTFDPKTLATVRAKLPFPDRLGPFNFRRPEDLALFFWFFASNGTLRRIIQRVSGMQGSSSMKDFRKMVQQYR